MWFSSSYLFLVQPLNDGPYLFLVQQYSISLGQVSSTFLVRDQKLGIKVASSQGPTALPKYLMRLYSVVRR